MTRPLRIEHAGAYYHVMNRGNRGEDIFLTDKDRQVFVDGLADSCETYLIKLIAYVLMSKHFPPACPDAPSESKGSRKNKFANFKR